MEEYRDLQLTAEAFMRTLDRPGLERIAVMPIPDTGLGEAIKQPKVLDTVVGALEKRLK